MGGFGPTFFVRKTSARRPQRKRTRPKSGHLPTLFLSLSIIGRWRRVRPAEMVRNLPQNFICPCQIKPRKVWFMNGNQYGESLIGKMRIFGKKNVHSAHWWTYLRYERKPSKAVLDENRVIQSCGLEYRQIGRKNSVKLAIQVNRGTLQWFEDGLPTSL